jgi:hypothetical protein
MYVLFKIYDTNFTSAYFGPDNSEWEGLGYLFINAEVFKGLKDQYSFYIESVEMLLLSLEHSLNLFSLVPNNIWWNHLSIINSLDLQYWF